MPDGVRGVEPVDRERQRSMIDAADGVDEPPAERRAIGRVPRHRMDGVRLDAQLAVEIDERLQRIRPDAPRRHPRPCRAGGCDAEDVHQQPVLGVRVGADQLDVGTRRPGERHQRVGRAEIVASTGDRRDTGERGEAVDEVPQVGGSDGDMVECDAHARHDRRPPACPSRCPPSDPALPDGHPSLDAGSTPHAVGDRSTGIAAFRTPGRASWRARQARGRRGPSGRRSPG